MWYKEICTIGQILKQWKSVSYYLPTSHWSTMIVMRYLIGTGGHELLLYLSAKLSPNYSAKAGGKTFRIILQCLKENRVEALLKTTFSSGPLTKH